MIEKQQLEEGLELLYLLKEMGISERSVFLREFQEPEPEAILRELTNQGAVTLADDQLTLTPYGLTLAEAVIRRHRLAEVLMHSVLMVENQEMEETACVFEHILSEHACDQVCTFLGHPTHCPHGRAIPPGRCCRLTREEDEGVQPLTEMDVGDVCRVIHIRPQHHARLDQLGAYGLVPDSVIRLHQKRPSFVVQIDETDLALDVDVASDIYVRREA
jgi:DtxR family Mn-dependent transcriptional regulator